jgi:hypothetical protein
MFNWISKWFKPAKQELRPSTVEAVVENILHQLRQASDEIDKGAVLKNRRLDLYVTPMDDVLQNVTREGHITIRIIPCMGGEVSVAEVLKSPELHTLENMGPSFASKTLLTATTETKQEPNWLG